MTSDEQQIRDLIATWMEASRRGETDRVLELMDEDVVFLGAGRPAMRGRAEFAAASRGTSGMSIDGGADVQEIHVSGDLAYCWNQLTVVVRAGDGTIVRNMAGPVLSVMRKGQDGRWRIFRDANMLAPVDGRSG